MTRRIKPWTGERVKAVRQELRMTQPSMARLIGCNRWQTVGEWERGGRISHAYQQILEKALAPLERKR